MDGPGGVGKGTLSQLLAEKLHWHLLDSGALYRILGIIHQKAPLPLENPLELQSFISSLKIEFLPADSSNEPARIILDGKDISNEVRSQTAGEQASVLSAKPVVRQAAIDWQRQFRQKPGLIADGRDMGVVIFPDAYLKIYLIADAKIRAKRRQKQLLAKGINVKLANLVSEIKARDERDSKRECSPMKPAEDAIIIDTSDLSIEEVLQQILKRVPKQNVLGF